MVYLIGQAPESPLYRVGTFDDFITWIREQKIYQLDIETTVTPWWCTKVLRTIQFGSHYDDINGKP
jgi:hypothetical protein